MNNEQPASTRRDLQNRVAIVTGGGRGIGRGIAEELGARGASVVVNYRRDEGAAAEVVEAIRASGSQAIAVGASMSETDEVDRLADLAIAEFGFVDILVNNAGIASGGLPVAETTPEELLRLMQVHAFSSHRLSARLIPQMRLRARSDIVMISSSEVPENRANGAPYSMAKNALESLAMTLAKEEVENGIRVNIVAPGLVVTDMGRRLVRATVGVDDPSDLDSSQPFGRVCRPSDIAGTVAFLVGPDAAMITGQRLTVDGGALESPLD